jgi:chemotaxis protein CheD
VIANTETMVRMGELALSSTPGDVLVSIGLGSCIGLALLDARRGVAGLAHIMLPGDGGARQLEGGPAKYAETAVPDLVEQLLDLGAVRGQLEAVLVGGAQMFAGGGSGLDIGARNDEATRRLLAESRIPIRAAATGGTSGRTVRVHVSPAVVTAKEVGGREVPLFS